MAPLAVLLFLIAAVPALLLFALSRIVRPRRVRIPIKGRHVLITGGSSGIGLAMARQAAAEGARVSILARSLPRLEDARDEIRRATGAEVAVYSVDVRDDEAVRGAVEAAGPIDVLVCNHGVFPSRELAVQDVAEIRYVVETNLMGTFHLVKAALPGMKCGGRGPRSIAIMSSQVGQVGFYGLTAYSASKFALRGLAESLQQEVIADNIHLSLIFPPTTDTPGVSEDMKTRPELTTLIATSSTEMKAEDVARRSWDGIKSGSFFVICNREGFMLSLATAGVSPQRSYMMAFTEVLFGGLMRFVGLCFLRGWYDAIEKWNAKQKVSKEKPGVKSLANLPYAENKPYYNSSSSVLTRYAE